MSQVPTYHRRLHEFVTSGHFEESWETDSWWRPVLLVICNVQNEPRYWRVQGHPNSELFLQFSILTPWVLNESIYTVQQIWKWYILWVWQVFCLGGDREFDVMGSAAAWGDLCDNNQVYVNHIIGRRVVGQRDWTVASERMGFKRWLFRWHPV